MPNYPKEIVFVREDLYKRIWETPITRLSKEFGISDVGLAKICRKLNIPRPPRGYWAKLQVGKSPRIPTLPSLAHGEPDKFTHLQSEKRDLGINIRELDQDPLVENEKIIVPEKLDDPHGFTRKLLSLLNKSKPDDYGMLYQLLNGISVRVSLNSLERGMRILDTLIKGLESRGFGLKRAKEDKSDLYLEIKEERFEISLAESTRRISHILSDEERAKKKAGTLWHEKRWDYLPTDNLSLKIETAIAAPIRKRWSDSKTNRLEENIAGFIIGLIIAAKTIKAERAQRAEHKKQWEDDRKKREEEEQLKKKEEIRLSNLEISVEQWQKSERIRAFIRAIESETADMEADEEMKKNLANWLSWAKEKANQIDPVKQSFPKKSSK